MRQLQLRQRERPCLTDGHLSYIVSVHSDLQTAAARHECSGEPQSAAIAQHQGSTSNISHVSSTSRCSHCPATKIYLTKSTTMHCRTEVTVLARGPGSQSAASKQASKVASAHMMPQALLYTLPTALPSASDALLPISRLLPCPIDHLLPYQVYQMPYCPVNCSRLPYCILPYCPA